MRLVCLIAILLIGKWAFATHQRAGEISYRYISGLTYEFTITTYTYTPSPADRPEIEVVWGDGQTSVIQRNSKVNLENNISRNIYIAQHTFSASGIFHVSFEDPNRNAGIVNIPSSVEVPFFIETTIVINPFIGGNSSPQLMNPPIDNGCTNVIYYHNPGAFDADGDSLSYELVACRGYDGEEIPGYSIPFASHSISIDPITGDFVWDTPTMAGEYNIAILIKEWRNGIMISSLVRDMQITIAPCNNQPPDIIADDTCVTAGTRLDLIVEVQDYTSTKATLSATGEPLYVSDSPAQFMTINDSVPFSTHFVWNTQCAHVKPEPYTVLFKAQDNGPQVELVSFKTVHIRVVAPKPENLQAVAQGNKVMLSWQPDACTNAIGYGIYRRDGSNPFSPDYCETGMPNDEGYYWIGNTTAWDDTSFVDVGAEVPLYHANDYCYRVVALFANGAESYVSDEACTRLVNDAPLIVNTDVITTDSLNGTVKVRWIAPPELDSITAQPPFFYDLYRIVENQEPNLLNATPIPVDPQDTVEYLDHDLNTSSKAYTYQIYLSNADSLIEKSDNATSIYLSATPADRQVQLSWYVRQPWQNVQYDVYRFNEITSDWDSIAETTNSFYTDYGLVNGQSYCYFVKARGYYWAPDTIGPLYNRSQRVCAVPIDNTPPEIPTLDFTTDCSSVVLQWSFSSDSAAQDARYYYIYYKPTLTGAFTCVDSFMSTNICFPDPCEYTVPSMDVIVGCFALQVADSNRNMSPISDSVCVDVYDCLDYGFPNVFTPNGDGINDFFEPFKPYSGIAKVNMQIYNRWGRRVFSTDNPDVHWNGWDETGQWACADGVYFYSCDVYVQTLMGEVVIPIHGSVTLIH